MRRAILALLLTCGAIASAPAQLSVGVGINVPGVSIGINVPAYPQLVRVPDYPVYYAPDMGANYFFYNGSYWVYESDIWYESTWYNGPWSIVDPGAVPLFVLRVPVRYYRAPPTFFGGWRGDAPPRWGEHWGRGWEEQHNGWDRWSRRAAPSPAPLPVYQRQYAGARYPAVDEQRALRDQSNHRQTRDTAARPNAQQAAPTPTRGPAPAAPARQTPPHEQRPDQHPMPYAEAPALAARGGPAIARPTSPAREHEVAQRPARPAERAEQPRAAPQERAQRGQEQEHDRGEGRGQDRKN